MIKIIKEQNFGRLQIRFDAKGSFAVYKYIGKLLNKNNIEIVDKDYENPQKYLKDYKNSSAPNYPDGNGFYEIINSKGQDQFIEVYGWTTPDMDGFNDLFGISSDRSLSDVYSGFVEDINKLLTTLEDWEVAKD